MIVLSGALVLVALVLLVFGAVDRNLPYVYASIGVSLLSLLLLLVGILQRRGELTGDEPDGAPTPVTDTSAEPVPALAGVERERAGVERSEVTAELATPLPVDRPASRRVGQQDRSAEEPLPVAEHEAGPVDEDAALEDDLAEDGFEDDGLEEDGLEDDRLEDDGLEDEGLEVDEPEEDEPEEGSGVTVLVVSGRPRYHLEGCRVLRGKEPQPLDRDDARTHGFSPCGVCKPDADETSSSQDDAPAAEQGVSFTEALFGASIFADAPRTDAPADEPPAADAPADDAPADEARTRALPDRPVQPVLPDVDTGPADRHEHPADQTEPPAELRGEDPADDPTLVSTDERAEASVAGDEESVPAEVVDDDPVLEEPVVEEPVVEEPVVEEPVVEPVSAEDVPVEAPPAEAEPSGEAVDDGGPLPARRRRTAAVEVAVPVSDDPAGQTPAVAASAAAQTSPGEPASGEQAPARTAGEKEAPAKKAPARKAPARKAPARKAPVKRAPAKKAPRREAVAEQAPATPTPAPQVKRPMVRTVRADALRPGAPSTGSTTRVSARAAAPAAGGSVVVVPDRDRFHRPMCRYVRDVAGATTLTKPSATRQGYAACGVCKP